MTISVPSASTILDVLMDFPFSRHHAGHKIRPFRAWFTGSLFSFLFPLNGKCEELDTNIEELKESNVVLEKQVYLENFKSTDGSSFQKNFLNFGQLDFDKEAYFAKGDSEPGWTNTPSIIGNTIWIGARRVYNYNNQHVLVEIAEFYPSPGRIWTNFYNVSYWSGWKSVTPQ